MPSKKLVIEPPIIAHRGASHYAPENTFAAFRKAKELGANWVEFDVMLTADEEAVVIHDETVNRTTNGKGRVCDFIYSDIKNLDAGSWFNTCFYKEKISTLREVLELLTQLHLSANIEIKAQLGREDITVNKVLSIIDEIWKNPQSPPLISSFSLPILEKVKKNSSHCIGFLMSKWIKEWRNICDDLDCVAVDVNHKILTPDRIKEIKSTNRLVLAYTVNDIKRARELFSWGVDAVFTDFPDKIISSTA